MCYKGGLKQSDVKSLLKKLQACDASSYQWLHECKRTEGPETVQLCKNSVNEIGNISFLGGD